MTYQVHPVANIFPAMSASEFDALKADIEAYGLREPIWTYGGQVIDGRHRMRACDELGVDVRANVYMGDDPVAFVISLNLHRRHLNESQRGMVAANLETLKHGERADRHANLHVSTVTREKAAQLLNVSPRTVAAAAKVRDEGAPELTEAVQSGRVSVSAASEFAELPEESKTAALSEIIATPEAAKEIVRDAVKAHVAHNSGNNEWYTPADYIEAARTAMGSIDTDPASSVIANERVQASTFFTIDDDGLCQKWQGNIWMNPPYAQPLISQFAEALVSKWASGEIKAACVLVNNATDTGWFKGMAEASSAICFTKGRVRFIDPQGKPSGSPLQGQAILYFGSDPKGFADQFCRFGYVYSCMPIRMAA